MAQYIYILVYFIFVEIVVIYTINTGIKKLEQRKLVNLYMLVRVAKIILSLAFIGIYALIVKTDIKNFAMVFLLFYLLSIGFETWYFISKERRNKVKKEE